MCFFRRVSKGLLAGFASLTAVSIFWSVSFQNVKAESRLSLLCVETVWCNVAQQIGGQTLKTTALLTAPGLDPHHFQPSPSLWRSVGQADGFLINGATYDDWAISFHKAETSQLIIAKLSHWQEGEDPHLFFDPDIVKTVAAVMADWLTDKAPQNKKIYQENLVKFDRSLEDIEKKLALFKQRYQGQSVALTEPAGERLLSRTGLDIVDQHWALSVMNGSGVSARETAQLEQSFKNKKIRALIVNPSVKSVQIANLMNLASQQRIPLVAIQENLPAGLTWQGWMSQILDQLSFALDQKDGMR